MTRVRGVLRTCWRWWESALLMFALLLLVLFVETRDIVKQPAIYVGKAVILAAVFGCIAIGFGVMIGVVLYVGLDVFWQLYSLRPFSR